MLFECDIERLKRSAKLFGWSWKICIITGLVAFVFYPQIFIINDSLLGLAVVAVISRILNIQERSYDGLLNEHSNEKLTVNEHGIKFVNVSTGYKFERFNDDVQSVSYSNFLGTPKVKVKFIGNEFYEFCWFKNSEDLYQQLKSKEKWVKKA
ncbi:hypothetical protein [Vibrio coralliilyticus]|uniref:hypothetical protein n=1 Tax=Vibrio coralliilyticus TaxID=190893 RepID=UPI001560A070|nr:hypothetical protein [Vibrio coralliilyticus]NRF17530.1 hypothetical protein [Vibrio coralliilyticus]